MSKFTQRIDVMSIEEIARVILSQKEYQAWMEQDALNAIEWHHGVGGLLAMACGNSCCIILSRRLKSPNHHIHRWLDEPDGKIVFVDLMYSDSPKLTLLAMSRMVQCWDHMEKVAFERREKGLRVFSPEFALKLAQQAFNKLEKNGSSIST